MKTLRLLTRSSSLAVIQAEAVKSRIEKINPDYKVCIKKVMSSGDKDRSFEAFNRNQTGIFVKELESALLKGEGELAVHCLKDMPSSDTGGLKILAYCRREAPNDVLVTSDGVGFKQLSAGMRMGSSSPRRVCQARLLQPLLKIRPLRGNVPTRIRKVRERKLDVTILAKAGLKRLGVYDKTYCKTLSISDFLPAAGQGIVVIQTPDRFLRQLTDIRRRLNHTPTQNAATAERVCMRTLKAGCQTPVAVYAAPSGNDLILKAKVYSKTNTILSAERAGSIQSPSKLGRAVAESLLKKGAESMIAQWRNDDFK